MLEILRIKLILEQHREIITNVPIFQYINNSSRKLYVLNLLKPSNADIGEAAISQGMFPTLTL